MSRIWQRLREEGFCARPDTSPRPEPGPITSVSIRSLDEITAAKGGSELEGTMLVAGALLKAGLRPYLAMTPERAFPAFDLDEEGDSQGALDLSSLCDPGATFAASFEKGTALFRANLRHFDEEADVQYRLVDVVEARRNGIKPL